MRVDTRDETDREFPKTRTFTLFIKLICAVGCRDWVLPIDPSSAIESNCWGISEGFLFNADLPHPVMYVPKHLPTCSLTI